MPRPIDVRIRPDVELAGGRQEVKREFDRIEADADRAASEIKRALSDIPPPDFSNFGDAAGEAAQDMEDRFADLGGSLDLSSLGGSITDQLSGLLAVGGPVAGIVAAAGAAFGDDLASGFDAGFSGARNTVELSIRTGLSDIDLQETGAAAGAAYAAGFGESLADLKFAAAGLESTLAGIDDSFDIEGITTKAQLLEDQFGIQIPQSAELARRAIVNGLAADSDQALELIFDTAQRLPFAFEESLDVLDEYSPVFAKMGIDGPRAANLIASAWEQGIFPNMERSAEAIQEFNIRLTETDTLRPVIEELGLSFESAQQRLANGEGLAVLTDVNEALLEMEDPARRNALALEIYGTAMEDVADPEAALQLFAQADAMGAVNNSLDDSVEALKNTQSEWQKASREVEKFGGLLGRSAAAELEKYSGSLNLVTSGFGLFSDGADEAAESAANGGDGFALMLDATEEAAKGVSDLTEEVFNLDDALSGFSDRFDADKIFRSLAGDIDDVIEATADLTAGSFDLATGFDTSTEAGRRAEAAAEGLSGNLDDLIQGFNEGTVGADELVAGQDRVQGALRQVASQMGLTQGETDALIAKYGEVPLEVLTRLLAVHDDSGFLDHLRALDRIPTEKITFLRTVDQGSRSTAPQRQSSSSGGNAFFADGGLAEGFGIVGEEGPELIDFRTPTRVYSNEDTQRILSGESSGSGASFDQLVGAFRQALNDADLRGLTIEQITVDEGRDVFAEIEAAAQRFAPALR